MGLAQIIASFQIYGSNRRLFDQMTAVAASGFLPVPSPDIVPNLLSPATAMAAGLLFTLSLGAGLAFLSAAVGEWWSRQRRRRRWTAAVPVGLQAALLLLMNSRGFDLWVSLYAVLIPSLVFWMTHRLLSANGHATLKGFWLGRGLPLVLLALGWVTQCDRSLFIDLRDHLLMSNAAGRAVSTFYYRYTLYAAEVFKPLEQKLIRTVAWPAAAPPPADIRRELIRHDYLPVAPDGTADLQLGIQDHRMVFERSGQTLWKDAIARFLADPNGVLADVSARTDLWPFFRAFTFYGVLLAFPMALYCLLFAGLRWVFGLFGRGRWPDVLSGLTCLLIGLGLLAFFHAHRSLSSNPDDVAAALASDSWQTRVAGLKEIRHRRLDVCAYPGYTAMLRSPHPQERYWLARALASGSNPTASTDILFLLDDPDLNVRTQAVDSIVLRKDRSAIPAIMSRLQTSPDWYFQFYAYRALRALGWNQIVSR